MFRKTVRATEWTDVEATVAQLRAAASHAGTPDYAVDSMSQQVQSVLGPLVRQGSNMTTTGRHLRSRQKIEARDYSVTIEFRLGERPSLFQRIARLFQRP